MATHTDDSTIDYGAALASLMSYLSTWSYEGRVGGVICTWWSSTLGTAVPHPMNMFPLVLGALELHSASSDRAWLDYAVAIGDALAGMVNPNGQLENSWGDIPGKTSGTVIYAAPALALSQLYQVTGEPTHLRAAQRLLTYQDEHYVLSGLNHDGVANQALKWAEALASIARSTNSACLLSRAHHIARRTLDQQIQTGPYAGAFYQSRTDDRLILVYQGKCLGPLVSLHAETGDKALLDAADHLAGFLLRSFDDRQLAYNYAMPTGPGYMLLRRARSLDRRLFRRRVPTYRLWRAAAKRWVQHKWPVFIARSANTLHALMRLSALRPEHQARSVALVRAFASRQLPHGPFANTCGYFGVPDQLAWQDVCSPTRWNAYAFELLAHMAGTSGVRPRPSTGSTADWSYEVPVCGLPGDLFQETPHSVQLSYEGSPLVVIEKPSGVPSYAAQTVVGEISGERS